MPPLLSNVEEHPYNCPIISVSFIFLSGVYFLLHCHRAGKLRELCLPCPIPKGQPCPELLLNEAGVTRGMLLPQPWSPLPGHPCCVVLLWHSLPWSSTTAGLTGKECFVLALPAWASFFCLGMRKLGPTFLYDTEPSWGLGTSTWVLLAVEYRNFLASTYVSIYHNPHWANTETSGVLSPQVQRYGDIN